MVQRYWIRTISVSRICRSWKPLPTEQCVLKGQNGLTQTVFNTLSSLTTQPLLLRPGNEWVHFSLDQVPGSTQESLRGGREEGGVEERRSGGEEEWRKARMECTSGFCLIKSPANLQRCGVEWFHRDTGDPTNSKGSRETAKGVTNGGWFGVHWRRGQPLALLSKSETAPSPHINHLALIEIERPVQSTPQSSKHIPQQQLLTYLSTGKPEDSDISIFGRQIQYSGT